MVYFFCMTKKSERKKNYSFAYRPQVQLSNKHNTVLKTSFSSTISSWSQWQVLELNWDNSNKQQKQRLGGVTSSRHFAVTANYSPYLDIDTFFPSCTHFLHSKFHLHIIRAVAQWIIFYILTTKKINCLFTFLFLLTFFFFVYFRN